jgi:hypothetical protein
MRPKSEKPGRVGGVVSHRQESPVSENASITGSILAASSACQMNASRAKANASASSM